MKLRFCGNADIIPILIQLGSDSTNQPIIKLIYRGHMYYAMICSVAVPKVVKTDEKTVTLIYRGNTYERKIPSPKPYKNPRAINWRYQTPAVI